jgi:hypothetical protein
MGRCSEMEDLATGKLKKSLTNRVFVLSSFILIHDI